MGVSMLLPIILNVKAIQLKNVQNSPRNKDILLDVHSLSLKINEIKHRQSNIKDLGYRPNCGAGWYDVQGQGVNNDYCRWVGDCGCRGSCSFWSCALAGSKFQKSPQGKYPKPACNEETLWNCYPCPEGFTRYGDGSACEFGSTKCDLGYVAGTPNLLPSCYIDLYEVHRTKVVGSNKPWNFYPCPEGLTRYGDGSACESGSTNCDLGYVDGRPNMLLSCEIKNYAVNSIKIAGSETPWNFYPCPPGFTRYGDGSACESGSKKCDLGFVAGAANLMDSCAIPKSLLF